MGRTPCCNADGLRKGAWTYDEDQKLIAYIQEHGEGGWRTLPLKAGLQRCGKSCRLRWANYLRPDIKRGEFSTEEEQKIIQLHSSLGNRWSAIARHLPKRTDNEIKNYWNTHLKKRLADMGIDPVTHNPIGSSPTNHSTTHLPCESQSDDICPSPTSGFSFLSGSASSTSTSAQLLNKIASKLAPSLKTTQDLLSNNKKDVIMDAESSSPISTSLDYPMTRRASTSAKLLNKVASRLNNTLKVILSKSTDQGYNNNYDNNNDNYLQRCASTSSLSESTSDISRSISTSNNGGLVVNNNNQDDDSNGTPLLGPLDLDVLKYWHGISDGGVLSTSVGVTYNGEPSMSVLNFNKDAPKSGCESSEFQENFVYTSSGNDVNDFLLATTMETTTSYDNDKAVSTSPNILDIGHCYKEHYFADGFSNFFIGDDLNMVNRESHFGGGCERGGRLLQEANTSKYYWNEDFSNFDSYGVRSDSF